MNKRRINRVAIVVAVTAVLSLTGSLSLAAKSDNAAPKEGGKDKAAQQKAHEDKAAGSKSAPSKPSSAHLAAKAEMVRKQKEQRITHDKRQAAADNLKAERLKVYNAKQAVKKPTPQPIESK